MRPLITTIEATTVWDSTDSREVNSLVYVAAKLFSNSQAA